MVDDLSNIIHLYNAGFYGSFPGKQNDIFFSLQRHAVRDFWFVKLDAIGQFRILTVGLDLA